MRVGYLGTATYAATVLDRLAESEFRPALVITPPDRRKGRGRKLGSPPVASTARERGLDLVQVESVNRPEALDRIRGAGLDLGVVCAFGQLIKPPLLEELELLNIHPSLLPRWRGAAPIERAIMAGDSETGVTIMRVSEGLDSGPIALQDREGIEADDDFGSLSSRLARIGGELVVAALGRRAAGRLELAEQDQGLASYAEKLTATDRRLDPDHPAAELERRVRALHPHVGAYLELDGEERLGVHEAGVVDDGPAAGALEPMSGSLVLGCAEQALRLDVVQPSGGKPMPVSDYLRGHPRLGSSAGP